DPGVPKKSYVFLQGIISRMAHRPFSFLIAVTTIKVWSFINHDAKKAKNRHLLKHQTVCYEDALHMHVLHPAISIRSGGGSTIGATGVPGASVQQIVIRTGSEVIPPFRDVL